MKKRIYFLSFLFILWSSVAFANPLLIFELVTGLSFAAYTNPSLTACIVNSVYLHLAAAGLIYSISSENARKSAITPSGNIKKPMEVWQVPPLAPSATEIPVQKADVTAKINYDDLQAIVQANPEKYPNTNAALTTVAKNFFTGKNDPDAPAPLTACAGSVVLCSDGYYYLLGSFVSKNEGSASSAGAIWDGTLVHVLGEPCGDNQYHYRYYATRVQQPAPSIKPASTSQFSQAMANSATPLIADTDVYSDRYGSEIDDFIKDNPNVVHYEDAAGNAATEAEIAHATDYQIKRALAFQASQVSVDSANTAASNARNRADSARAASNASPGDSSLAAAASAAEAAADAAEASAAAARANAESQKANYPSEPEEDLTVPSLPGDNTYNSDVDQPDKKNITDLLSGWASSSPLTSIVKSFSIETSSPIDEVSIGTFYGREIKFSFARYADIFSVCGGVLLVIVHGFAVLIVMRGW